MATYRTKDPLDAARFVRALRERGYTKDPRRKSTAGPTLRNTYRVSKHHRFLWVAYFEPHEIEKRTKTPDPVEKVPRRAGRKCSEPRCNRRHMARGLCKNHYMRWYYHTNDTFRVRKLATMAAKRLARMAAERKEAA